MILLETKRKTRRSIWLRRIAILTVAAGLVGAWLAKDAALLRYHKWKEQRALAQAKQFVEQKEPAKAKMALDVALAAVPGNPDAWRVAADIMEQVGSSQALRLRRGIVQLNPSSAEDRAALVISAVKFRDLNAANEALSEMTPAQARQPVALRAALAYAIATENAPVADALYDQLKPLYPQNDDLKVAHATLRLRLPKPERAAEARAELETLAKNPKYAGPIYREFMVIAIQQKDLEAAKRWAGLLTGAPGAGFSDQLQKANLELLVDHRPFAEVFPELKAKVPATPADTVQFARWLMVQTKSPEADQWLGALPPAVRDTPEVRSVRAEVVADLKDWDRLGGMIEAGAWGAMPKDVVSLAMSARTVGARGNATLQRQVWDEALRAAGTSMAALRALQRLAGYWRWEDESERTLWAIARTFPDQTWAHQELFSVYRRRKNTEGMRNVLTLLREGDGTLLRYQADWAVLSLLVDPNSSWNPPKETLEQLYRQQPENAFFATGYAFALALVQKGPEALAVVEKMPKELREYPPRAPYLAYVYAMNRRPAEFETYAAIAAKAELLPEEVRLVTEGRDIVKRPPVKAAPAKNSAPAKSGTRPATPTSTNAPVSPAAPAPKS